MAAIVPDSPWSQTIAQHLDARGAWAGLTPTVRSSDDEARARAHLPPGLQGAALGARRGHPEGHPGRRPAARGLRADRQAPRPQDRQGRRRAQDPHALLLRPARRRNPLPAAVGPGERAESHGAVLVTAAAHLAAPPARPQPAHARASSFLCLASPSETAAGLIEPPSPARHPAPPSANGWMTGTPRTPAGTRGRDPAPHHPSPMTTPLPRAHPLWTTMGPQCRGRELLRHAQEGTRAPPLMAEPPRADVRGLRVPQGVLHRSAATRHSLRA
jgi:hypothetical protein